jgi:hypothetical protein
MTRFILFFTFIKIFLSYPSFAATEEAPNPTHTVLKHTFTTLKRWSALPDTLKKPLIELFPGSFSELDALNAFEEVTRGILKDTPSLSLKLFTDRTKDILQSRYSIESHEKFLFPMMSRSIAKEALLDYAWTALSTTACGKVIVEANRSGTLKDSIVFYGLFSVSHEDYASNQEISGFTVIKNFFVAGAVGSPLAIRPGFMDRAVERGLMQQQLLMRSGSSGSSAYTSLTDGRSTRTGSRSITPVDMDVAFEKESSDSSPDSSHAQAGGGGGEGRAASPASFNVASPRNQHGVVTPKSKRKETGKPGSALRQPLLGPDGQDSTNYTDPESAPTGPAKQGSCCSIL